MGYDLDHVEKECPCPCGKGRIVYGSGTNDWNQIQEGMIEIWCPDCNSRYEISSDGLLPKDFPDYMGDKSAYKKMSNLSEIIRNYRGNHCWQYWSKEIRVKRLHLYLTDDEIEEDKASGNYNNLRMALFFSKKLADTYSKKDLEKAQEQLEKCKYSTQLTGIAKDITRKYKDKYNSVKVSNVIISVNMAIRNYKAYKEADKEDEAYLSGLKKELKKAEEVYYKDYEKYEENRRKHLIFYDLKDVRKRKYD